MKISTDNSALRKVIGDIPAMKLIKDAGFDGIDYSFYDLGDFDILMYSDAEREKTAAEIKACAKETGIEFPQCHAYLSYVYGNIAIDEADEKYLRVIRSMEYAHRIGCRKIVIHDLKCPLDMDDATADSINAEFMRSFLPYAEKYELIIGVENLFKHDKPNKKFYGRHMTPEWMNSFVDRLGSDLYEVCLDIGHAEICGASAVDFINGMSPERLTMLHVQDTDFKDDRHWLPYMGKHDWEGITSALAAKGFAGPMNFEVLHFYDKFTPDLWPDALKLSASVARSLADKTDAKRK